MTPEKFSVGLLQTACAQDTVANLNHTCEKVREAARQGAQIICTEELFRSQYFCREEDARLFDLAETIPGPSTERLQPLAAELGVVIVASLFEKRATGLYHNTAVIIDADGTLLGPLSQDAHSRRSALLREVLLHAGRSWLPRLRYEIRPHRNARLLGPVVSRKLLVSPPCPALTSFSIRQQSAGIPRKRRTTATAQHDAWRTIQRSHAIANGIYVAAVNRVGFEGPPDRGLEFWGASFVSDPFGRILAEASHDKEETLVVECDPALMEDVRRNWPFLRDRRIDAYGPITQPVSHVSTDSHSPRALGFRMPAEWEPHEATWIAWPHNEDDWPGRFAPIPWVYGEIVRKLSAVERVQILVHNEDFANTRAQDTRKSRSKHGGG